MIVGTETWLTPDIFDAEIFPPELGYTIYRRDRVNQKGSRSIILVNSILLSECKPGPSCSKLTMSLVNDSLKFQMAISQIHCYFLLKNVRILCIAKDSHIFSTKNNNVFAHVVGIYLTS